MTIGTAPPSAIDLRPRTLISLLRWRGQAEPDRLAYRFLLDGETEEAHVTYGELDRRAQAVAAILQSLDAGGERALLLYPPGLDYITAFFGCLYAGVVAVPAYPPRTNRNNERLQAIADDARATLALTTHNLLKRMELSPSMRFGADSLRWLATDRPAPEPVRQWSEPETLSEDALAYLQYTSGSTSAPKGVMVSHVNVLHNSAYIHQGFAHTPDSLSLSWLPHFHDMGLLDGIIQPLYGGFPCILMSPAAFLQRPLRWLEAISRYKVTHSGGPNFGYDLCVRRVSDEQRATLDLSSWRVAYNGSEPVRRETLEGFAGAFAPCGFRRSSFYPAYGLAEATLKVSGGRAGDGFVLQYVRGDALEQHRVVEAQPGERDARALVGSGHTSFPNQTRIVHPETLAPCAPDEVGEIWVAGPGVARGYWQNAEGTEHTFRAYLPETGEGPYLRTGDLGFVKDGELFVTGRLKDLIIIRGRNYYPQDIELAVERCHASLRVGAGAAFSVEPDGEERLVIAQEVESRRREEWPTVIAAIREAVAGEFEIQPAAVVLLKPGSIPKTSSGKVRRVDARIKFLSGEWETIAEWRAPAGDDTGELAAPSPAETASAASLVGWLQERLAAMLGVARAEIDAGRPLMRYGVDSLMAVELMHGIELSMGVSLPLAEMLESPSLYQLAALATRQASSIPETPTAAPARSEQQREATGAEDAGHALSYNQQSLWFLHEVAPESAAYNVAFAARIRGGLDTEALRRAFRSLVERHASLRTSFAAVDGEPVQRVHERAELFFQLEDASRWSEPELRERLSLESRHHFDLAHSPLLRVWLFKRSATEHALLLVAHHIIVDFWSLSVLMHELGALYRAETDGTEAALAAQTLRYTDYASRQREFLNGAEGERQRQFWQEQLSGELPVLELPLDRARPVVQSHRGASVALRLDAKLTGELKSLARSNEATLYMALLAAFQVLLYRHTGQRDVVVGSPTSGRSSAQLADVVGYFVNPVVVRATLSDELTFSELLSHVRRTTLAAFAHQDYPFNLLVKQLQPERDPARSPLFQVMFALHKAREAEKEQLAAFALGEEGAAVNLGGVRLESVALDQRVAQFDLALTMAEVDGELTASFEYCTDLFDAATINRLAEHFRMLLEAVASEPTKALAALPLLTVAERAQLLVEWNEPPRTVPSGQWVHTKFEQQAARRPDSLAVICTDGRGLSYRELNARANQLARHLCARGVGQHTLVALCIERSVEMVVGVLATLKAGGAYVPLDPAYPQERLAFMLKDSGASCVLTRQSLADDLHASDAQVVLLDTDWPVIARESDANLESEDANLECEAGADSSAYVIYTSGSTGVPKGVLIGHGALANYIEAVNAEYGLSPDDRLLQFASFSFDVSVEEIFACLTSGATLLLRDDEMAAQPSSLLRACVEHRITVLTLPTAYWHQLTANLTADDWAQAGALRLCVIGSEKIQPARLAQWHSCVGARVRLIDVYGPTEATIGSTFCDLTGVADTPDTAREISIGRPIRNTQALILDARLEPVPIGVAGELHLGGVGLALGYLHRPELTAEKFIPHPFSHAPGARLYKTGDLARFLADGRIEFLGRLDDQVKVRGFRVEPGEIERALMQHARVRDAAVIVRDEQGDRRLVAYLVADTKDAPTTSDLRRHLKERLPEYMLPSAFVMLDRLPLTPGGKVDKPALPAPDRALIETASAFVAPRSEAERSLAGIWAEVLKLERVGLHDNFFELGGDSILTIQVIARAERAGLHLTARQMFTHPTVAELAAIAVRSTVAQVEQSPLTGELPTGVRDASPGAGGHAPSDFPLARLDQSGLDALLKVVGTVADLYPLTPTQQGMLFHTLYSPEVGMYMGQLSCVIEGDLDERAFAEAWRRVAARHTSLRTSFVWENLDEPLQVVRPSVELKLDVHDWRASSPAEQERLLESFLAEDWARAFDLSRAPLLRLALLRTADASFRFVWTHHHLLLDGWSASLLMREVFELYEALRRGEEPRPASVRPFSDYLYWLRKQDASKAERFWREQLEGFGSPTPLPARWLDAADAGPSRPSKQQLQLTPEETASLQTFARRHHLTLSTLAHGAFALLLNRYSAEEDVVFGTTVSGRPPALPGVESMTGLFINTLPVRVRVTPESSVVAWLRGLQDKLVELRDYEYISLAEVQRSSDVPRGTSLFESLLVFENYPMEETLVGRDSRLKLGEVDSFELTNYPLTVIALPGAELSLQALYTSDRFDAATVERLLEHLKTLLLDIAARPDSRLTEVQLLSEVERRRILTEWNGTARAYSRESSVSRLFEEQAERSPDAVALVQGGRQLSFDELNRRANQVAHHLRRLGVGPEMIVGVCVERSPELVVGLLGALKAGAAYMPMDPDYPRDRLAFMAEHARAPVLLTQRSLSGMFEGQPDARVVCLDADWDVIAREAEDNPASVVAPNNVAYVIYTSGSTGRPKGVAISQSSVLNLIQWYQRAFAVTPSDRSTQLSGIGFDVSVMDLWPNLTAGVRVYLPDEETRISPEKLRDWFIANEITVGFAPTPMAEMLLEMEWPEAAALRVLVTGGDKLHHFPKQGLGFIVANLYGPTENTVISTGEMLTPGERAPTQSPPIGRPLDNEEVYILDKQSRPVPVGVAGELYLGGVGLARGYWMRPDLTAEAFTPHPFSALPGARLYRTGDLARYLPDGRVEFLGRIDYQVKIRGYRIELGEIETVLSAHAAVGAAIVLLREDVPGEKRLVAYVVAADEERMFAAGELRAYLRERLPEYMIPANIVVLDALPLTPNGKVDRRVLPAPGASVESENFVAPRSPLEDALADIWRDVLGVERVGINDNFFELGGHSLMATRVLSKVRRLFRLELPLRVLFEAHTVAELAHAIMPFETQAGQTEKIARVLQKLKGISAEDVKKELLRKRGERDKR